MLGRPKFKANGVEYLVLPSKAASKNIKFTKDGQTWYVPLVSGTAGQFASENGKSFKLGYLKVDDKYGVVDMGSIPEISIVHQPYHVRNGRIYPINPLEFTVVDADNNFMTVTLKSMRTSSGSITGFIENKTWNNISNAVLQYCGDVYVAGKAMGYPYSINVEITSKNTKGGSRTVNITDINNDSIENTQFEHRLYWIDKDNTYYTGTQTNDVIHLTGHHGRGTPYHYFTGFNADDVGKTVKWDIYNSNGESVKDAWLSRCEGISNTVEYFSSNAWVDITTRGTPTSRYGVRISEGWIPNGEYDLVMVLDNTPKKVHDYGVHIIMDDSNTPYYGNLDDQNAKYWITSSGNAPTIGQTYTSNSTSRRLNSDVVWADEVTISSNAVVDYTAMPEGTSYTVDSIISSYTLPGGTGSSGAAGGTVYKCNVHGAESISGLWYVGDYSIHNPYSASDIYDDYVSITQGGSGGTGTSYHPTGNHPSDGSYSCTLVNSIGSGYGDRVLCVRIYKLA